MTPPAGGSVTISRLLEETALIRFRRTSVAALALIALLFAQSAVCLHVLKHLAAGDGGIGQPATEARLCLDCVSIAPLVSAHGGALTAFAVAPIAGEVFADVPEETVADRQHRSPFRSRAPPR